MKDEQVFSPEFLEIIAQLMEEMPAEDIQVVDLEEVCV